jgi:hypothetical protein
MVRGTLPLGLYKKLKPWNVPFYFGGTSLLIIVVVVMDFIAQVQAHMISYQYESLLKKTNMRGGGWDHPDLPVRAYAGGHGRRPEARRLPSSTS